MNQAGTAAQSRMKIPPKLPPPPEKPHARRSSLTVSTVSCRGCVGAAPVEARVRLVAFVRAAPTPSCPPPRPTK